MSSFSLNVDAREAQYARLVGNVLATLRGAVMRRGKEGLTRSDIADRIGMDKSAFSRVLNGRVSNLTLKTVSDILWSAEHEPVEFRSDGFEDLSPNHRPEHLLGSLSTTHGAPVRMRVYSIAGADPVVGALHSQAKELSLTHD